jgi:type IV secretory pathway VirB4 component
MSCYWNNMDSKLVMLFKEISFYFSMLWKNLKRKKWYSRPAQIFSRHFKSEHIITSHHKITYHFIKHSSEFHKWSYYHSLLWAVHRPDRETTECLCVQFSARVRKQAEILWSCDRHFPCKQQSHRNEVNVVIKQD